eukprot:scaffold142034_cov28-Tisochrysis_lutea.AAC.1
MSLAFTIRGRQGSALLCRSHIVGVGPAFSSDRLAICAGYGKQNVVDDAPTSSAKGVILQRCDPPARAALFEWGSLVV